VEKVGGYREIKPTGDPGAERAGAGALQKVRLKQQPQIIDSEGSSLQCGASCGSGRQDEQQFHNSSNRQNPRPGKRLQKWS